MLAAPRVWVVIGALNGLMGVAAGAYGAHGLAGEPDYLVRSFNTGVDYQMWHALALLAVAWLVERSGGAVVPRLAGLAFVAGIVLFSGSLYFFGITADVPFSGSAPAGGVALMAGWALTALGALSIRTAPEIGS
ncbi:MAG: DUF423 domain-containing protein [Rhodospirillales bacterium]